MGEFSFFRTAQPVHLEWLPDSHCPVSLSTTMSLLLLIVIVFIADREDLTMLIADYASVLSV
jgi:hypothetical protein